MVYGFGFISVLVCFALALGTLLFSTGDSNGANSGESAKGVAEPSTFMGVP
jgi:hypothetical protein